LKDRDQKNEETGLVLDQKGQPPDPGEKGKRGEGSSRKAGGNPGNACRCENQRSRGGPSTYNRSGLKKTGGPGKRDSRGVRKSYYKGPETDTLGFSGGDKGRKENKVLLSMTSGDKKSNPSRSPQRLFSRKRERRKPIPQSDRGDSRKKT